MSILIYQKESGTLNKCFVAHLDTHKGYRSNISRIHTQLKTNS